MQLKSCRRHTPVTQIGVDFFWRLNHFLSRLLWLPPYDQIELLSQGIQVSGLERLRFVYPLIWLQMTSYCVSHWIMMPQRLWDRLRDSPRFSDQHTSEDSLDNRFPRLFLYRMWPYRDLSFVTRTWLSILNSKPHCEKQDIKTHHSRLKKIPTFWKTN